MRLQPGTKLLAQVLRRGWSALALGPRLVPLGARPSDRLRLLGLGLLVPVLDGFGLRLQRHAHIRVRLQGDVVPVTLGDASDYFVLAAARTTPAIPDFITAPASIIDCGAHIGTIALQYRLRFPAATIFAVEPDPATCARLRKNLRGTSHVNVIQAAVSGATGEASFVQSHHSWTSSLISSRINRRGSSIPVRTLTLTDLLDHCRLAAVDLLKLDIEGAELDVLGDAAGVSRVNAIVGEIHYDLGGFTEEQLMARLRGFDAKLVPYSADRALLLARRVDRPTAQASEG